MKKAAICFSLTVLLIFSVYVSLKIADNLKQSPTYEGVVQETINKAIEDTGSISAPGTVASEFRSFDSLGEAAILLTAAAGIFVVLGKSKKSKGGSKS